MTLVVDASVVVAALADEGSLGGWAEQILRAGPLVAPHHMPAEVTSTLRRLSAVGHLTADAAGLAQAELSRLSVEYFPFEPVADRVWELRATVTSYDAWYVALAEGLQLPLATLDHRLVNVSGPRCDFRTFDR